MQEGYKLQRTKKLFSDLIFCDICKKKYRFKKERMRSCYICQSYSNYKTCSRRQIEQDTLIWLILKYLESKNIVYQLTNEYMKTIIKEIIVDKDSNIFIYYKDGNNQHITNNEIKIIDTEIRSTHR